VGIAELLAYALSLRTGRPEAEERKRIWLVDSRGLVTAERAAAERGFAHHKLPFAHAGASLGAGGDAGAALPTDLDGIVALVRPTALIGVSAQPSTFTASVVKRMAALNARPLIFSLSNPTSKSECTAEQAYEWSAGAAVFVSGSPFDAVTLPLGGVPRTFHTPQGNNAYIFPAVGLATLAVGISKITNHTMYVAADALAACADGNADPSSDGFVYPPLRNIRAVSLAVATAVAEDAYAKGVATLTPKPADMTAHLRSCMWDPAY
jgi:malate dehydrogenase (oxaloacetate-decarboxylating)(NADP+)